LGVSQWNQHRLLASLYSVSMGQTQNPILTTMDLNKLEIYIMDEWVYIPIMLLVLLNSFGIGLVLGTIWVYL